MALEITGSKVGCFTSSEIVKLTTFGKIKMTKEELANRPKQGPGSKSEYKEGGFSEAGLTYIEECNMEREFGRSLETETNARSTSWGTFVEKRAFDLLPMEYQLVSHDVLHHPTIPYWKGTPDVVRGTDTVGDCKCPITLKSFYQLVSPYKESGKIIHEALTIEAVRANHKEGDTYYFQLVSNAILTGAKFAELIVYMPYKSELSEIREMAANFDGDQNKIAWLNWANDEDLPYLIDGGKFKNLNVIRFEVKEEDKEFLTKRVLEAGKLLIDLYKQ